MAAPETSTALPADLETIFTTLSHDPDALFTAFMPAFCDHLQTDRIFLQPRNPLTRVCKVIRWRRGDDIPWPNFPNIVPNEWFRETHWEIDDPLWRAALELKPSIYVEDLEVAAAEGLLSLEFEKEFMGHSAFVHGHAHWPPLSTIAIENQVRGGGGIGDGIVVGEKGQDARYFYGSVQPAVFSGPRAWSADERRLVETCLVRIAPIMKAYGDGAPAL